MWLFRVSGDTFLGSQRLGWCQINCLVVYLTSSNVCEKFWIFALVTVWMRRIRLRTYGSDLNPLKCDLFVIYLDCRIEAWQSSTADEIISSEDTTDIFAFESTKMTYFSNLSLYRCNGWSALFLQFAHRTQWNDVVEACKIKIRIKCIVDTTYFLTVYSHLFVSRLWRYASHWYQC